MSLADLPLNILLTDTADNYQTLTSLPPAIPDSPTRRPGKPGSRVPPGVTAILDADEYDRTIHAVDNWAEHLANHLHHTQPGIGRIPDTTTAKLRLAARWADKLETEPDPLLRHAFRYETAEQLHALRRLIRQRNRIIRTGSPCLDITCKGTYRMVVEGPDADDALKCSRCGDVVPRSRWEQWSARSEWVTVRHAASMLGVPTGTIKSWAHRDGWKRQGRGRHVRYLTADVLAKAKTLTGT